MRWHSLGLACCLAGLLVSELRAEPADDQYLAAANHYSQARWTQAREAFAAFLAAYPAHPQADQARFYLGETLIQLHEYPAAAEHFHQFIATKPTESLARKSLYRAGEAQFFARQYDAAARDLKQFLNQYPTDKLNAYVLAYLGDIALDQGDAAKAEAFYSEGLERFPQGALSGDCRLGLGRAWERQGKLAEARKLYADAAGRNDAWADAAQLRLAASYLDHKDFEVAVAAYEAFLAKFAASPLIDQARLGLGQAHYHLQQDAEAERAFRAIPAGSRQIADAQYGLGLVQLRHRQWVEAAEALRAAVTAQPKHPQAPQMLFLAGDALFQAGQFVEARQCFQRALLDWPYADVAAQCHWSVLRCAVSLAEQQTVVDVATQFVEKFPTHPDRLGAQLHHARALFALGKSAEVIPLLEGVLGKPAEAAANQPPPTVDRLTAHYLLALAYQSQQRSDDVLRTLQPLLASTDEELKPTRQDAWRLQAAVLVGQSKFPEAIAALQHYLQQPTTDGEGAARAQLAICLVRNRQTADAKQALAAFLASKPTDELRKVTLEALAEAALAIGDEDWAAELAVGLGPNGGKDNVLATYQAARTAEKQGQFEQAAALYERLVATPPRGVDRDLLVYNAAWAWKQAAKPQQARAAFERLHRDFAESRYWADATYRLAEFAADAGQPDDAQKLLAAVVRREQAGEILIHALYLQGQLAVGGEKWTEAVAPLVRIVDQFPNHALRPLAEFWLAEGAYRARQYDEALKRLADLSARLGKDNGGQAWTGMIPLRRAQILVQQKKFDEARQIAAAIAQEHPNFEQQYEADYVLGRTLAAVGQFDQAREAYQRAIRSPKGGRTETAAMAQWMLAETYFHQRKYDEAIKEYLRVETIYPFPTWQALALLQAGKCYELLGQYPQAGEAFARLIKNYPGTTAVDEASKRLQAAREQTTRK